MSWYYAEEGQQKGPISEPELESLHASGKIRPDTLVWTAGMANWQAYNSVRGPQATAPPPAAASPAASGGVLCSQCGLTFSPNDVIRYGDAWVCANCKPAFVQRLQEGAAVGTRLDYAGFWIRFVAYFVDQLILGVIGGIMGLVISLTLATSSQKDQIVAQVISAIIGLVLGGAYNTWFVGKFGATPGKMACRIKIVTAAGAPVTYQRAFGRYMASILSGLICAIGYIMAGFDDEKRALHDRICDTRVVKQS